MAIALTVGTMTPIVPVLPDYADGAAWGAGFVPAGMPLVLAGIALIGDPEASRAPAEIAQRAWPEPASPTDTMADGE